VGLLQLIYVHIAHRLLCACQHPFYAVMQFENIISVERFLRYIHCAIVFS